MTFSRRVHPEAAEELLDAIRYYEELAEAGHEFAFSARRAAQDAVDSPEAWPPVADWSGEPLIRSLKVGHFPYRVIYYLRATEIVIVAHAHTRRKPGYWKRRL